MWTAYAITNLVDHIVTDDQQPPQNVVPIKPGTFQKGHKKVGGRKPQTENKTPRLLKEAILMAAELEGSNQHGKDQLVGFLRRVAREDLKSFCTLLGRVIPTQIETRTETSLEVTYRSVDEVRRELASRGIDLELVARIINEPATVIDGEAADGDPV